MKKGKTELIHERTRKLLLKYAHKLPFIGLKETHTLNGNNRKLTE